MCAPAYLAYAIGFLWLWSGVQPIVSATEASLAMLANVGIGERWQWVLLVLASGWDVVLGVLCFSRVRHWSVLWLVQLATVWVYSMVIALALPENWLHPFAPLVKNVPIMALMVFVWQSTRQQGVKQ